MWTTSTCRLSVSRFCNSALQPGHSQRNSRYAGFNLRKISAGGGDGAFGGRPRRLMVREPGGGRGLEGLEGLEAESGGALPLMAA